MVKEKMCNSQKRETFRNSKAHLSRVFKSMMMLRGNTSMPLYLRKQALTRLTTQAKPREERENSISRPKDLNPISPLPTLAPLNREVWSTQMNSSKLFT
jgi:hypothetical protein